MCILLLFAFKMSAQSVQALETKFNSINQTLIIVKAKMDSLNNYLNNKVKEIDNEKEKRVRDNSKITQLMASSVTISSEIDIQKRRIDALESEIELLKRKLNNSYTSIIDSLNYLENSSKKNVDKDEIESQIAVYTEKKINVAPKIHLLSLYPKKILEIDLNKINDSSERQIYRDYLQKALQEVNSHIDDVEEQMKETKNIITLKKKTQRFLEESELESNIRPQDFSTGGKTVTSSNNGSYTGISTRAEAALVSQAQSYNLLLNQLNINPKTDANVKWNVFIDNKNPSVSVEQYHNLLVLVKKRLEEYRLVLLHKLNKAK